VPGTGLEPVQLSPRDFKSLVSTNFTTRAEDGRFAKGGTGPIRLLHVVPRKGLEPPHLSAPEPKSGASTNFATWATGPALSRLA
jgi:hypothetical protein